MALTTDIKKAFAKAVQESVTPKKEQTFLNGTIVKTDGASYVKIDGSDRLTPVKTTSAFKNDDRVTVMIKDHSVVVTGNYSDPSNQSAIDDISASIDKYGTLIADKASIQDLEAVNANIENLSADNVTIHNKLTAYDADITNLKAQNVTITGNLTANKADIDNLKANKLDVQVANAKFATIENLDATNANIHNLTVDFGNFKNLTTDKITANTANIEKLETDKLSVKDAEIKYANIDFANITEAAVEHLFAQSGIIGDLVVSDGHITGTLVGVTIKGDLIEGGTVVADKLVIKGNDGLYYKLNTDGEKVGSEQTEYNSLNGSVITAKSVTAEKITVDDLVAFGATIGGYHIGENKLYSGVKEDPLNTTRGVYMDDDGQFAVGDTSNYLRFFKDTNDGNKYKLEISAASIKFGAEGKDLESTVSNIVMGSVDIGGRNFLLNTTDLSYSDGEQAAADLDLTDTDNINGYGDFSNIYAEQPSETAETDAVTDSELLAVRYTFGASFAGPTTSDGAESKYYRDAIVMPLSYKDCLPINDNYILSFDYRGNVNDITSVYFVNEANKTAPTKIIDPPQLVVNETEWQHFQWKFPATEAMVKDATHMVIFDSGLSELNATQGKYNGNNWVEIRCKSLKLERGTTPTDWTPAPEETDQNIVQTQTEITRDYQTAIETNGQNLLTQVSETYTKTSDFNEYKSEASTQIEQTANAIQLKFDKITTENASKIDGTQAQVNAINSYIRFEDGNIILGEADNPITLTIENDRISFKQNNNEIAYISDDQLFINSARVNDQLDFGKFSWQPSKSGGGVSFVYVGQ